MPRRLPWGRHTKASDAVVTEALRQAGIIGSFGNKGIFGDILDKLFFEAHGYEHLLGSSAQLTADYATMTWDESNQRFENKAGAEVVVDHYERVAVMGMDTLLVDNLVIDNITGLEMFHIGNTPGQTGDNPKFQLGDAGSGAPYKIKLGPNTKDCKLDLLTDKPFNELSRTLNLDEKRYIANQGRGNYIRVNGVEIYNPSTCGEIITLDATPTNPYLVRMDGQAKHWMADASNVNLAWFRDLNVALGGLASNGTNMLETQNRFTFESIIENFPWLFQVNSANRFFTDLSTEDARLHRRKSPTPNLGDTLAEFTLGDDVVNFPLSPYTDRIRNGMRIIGGLALPDSDTTTVLLVDIDTTAHTAKMINGVTGDQVFALATTFGGIFNNSGAASGSYDDDFIKHISGTVSMRIGDSSIVNFPTGIFSVASLIGPADHQGFNASGLSILDDRLTFNTLNVSGLSAAQTQPKSTAVLRFYRP